MDPVLISGVAALKVAAVAVVAFLFLGAARGKLRSGPAFRGVVRDYRLLPSVMVAPVAFVLPYAEAAVGAGLLVRPGFAFAVYPAAALLLVFAAAAGVNLLRGRRDISCGCFMGPDGGRRIGWGLVARNIFMAAVLMAAAHTGAAAAGARDWLGGVLMGAVLLLLYRTLAALALHGPLLPGRSAMRAAMEGRR